MSIVVHWYHTSSPDAFTGKYSLEMVKDLRGTSRKRRRKNLPSMSTLTLDHVVILVYDFSLTKTGHLRQTTIKIIVERHDQHRPDRLSKPRTGLVGTDRLGRVRKPVRRPVRREGWIGAETGRPSDRYFARNIFGS